MPLGAECILGGKSLALALLSDGIREVHTIPSEEVLGASMSPSEGAFGALALPSTAAFGAHCSSPWWSTGVGAWGLRGIQG